MSDLTSRPASPCTVAVTGSAGFIGSHLVDRLLALGHRVVGIDNLSYGRPENFQHLLEHPRFRFEALDVCRRLELERVTAGCDCFVHLAALKIPRYGGALATLQVNHDGTAAVLELARASRRKVVLASTSDVYGMSPELPFREDGPLLLGPPSVKRWAYAISKAYDEQLALAYAEEYGFPVVPLRFFGTYGPRHHLSWWGGPQAVFFSACLRGEPLPIHGDGLQTRSFTWIGDLVDGLVAALFVEAANNQVLNLGSTEEVTILELARQVHRACGGGGEPELRFVPYSAFTGRRYDDVRRRVPDPTLARELLGWSAQVTLAEGLCRTVDWHREALARQTSEPPQESLCRT